MIIFCDGVFDMFHYGHINHFKQIKDLYPESYLIVGVLSDKLATDYKRKPILNEFKRAELVKSCRYVNKVTCDFPLIMTENFIKENNIDLVVHAFSNKMDLDKQLEFFAVPIKLDKFKILDYDNSISTTAIINNLKVDNN